MTTGPKSEMSLREKLHRDRIAEIRGNMILSFSLGVIGVIVAVVMAPMIWGIPVAFIALSLSVPLFVAGLNFASEIEMEEKRYNRWVEPPENP